MFCSHWHLKMDAKWKFKKFVLMLLHLWCCYIVFVLIDIKDNVSDTTSESSSLNLDFFAPSTTQPSEGKPGIISVLMNEFDKIILGTYISEMQSLYCHWFVLTAQKVFVLKTQDSDLPHSVNSLNFAQTSSQDAAFLTLFPESLCLKIILYCLKNYTKC